MTDTVLGKAVMNKIKSFHSSRLQSSWGGRNKYIKSRISENNE